MGALWVGYAKYDADYVRDICVKILKSKGVGMTNIDKIWEERQRQMEKDILENKELVEAVQEPLKRLMEVADGDTGQSVRIARFLLGLYNGPAFPFDLTDLRAIDRSLKNDCLDVLAMDSKACEMEVHHYIEDGKARFEMLAGRYLDKGIS